MKTKVKFLLKDPTCQPKQAHKDDAGFDLISIDNVVLRKGARVAIDCGFQMELEPGFEAQIRPRSGLAAKHGLSIVNTPGTIDAGYRGDVKVILINHGDYHFEIKKGDRIAQMVINELPKVDVEIVDKLEESDRGEKGFGSSGVSINK